MTRIFTFFLKALEEIDPEKKPASEKNFDEKVDQQMLEEKQASEELVTTSLKSQVMEKVLKPLADSRFFCENHKIPLNFSVKTLIPLIIHDGEYEYQTRGLALNGDNAKFLEGADVHGRSF